jgi:signal transduction histidine kinase
MDLLIGVYNKMIETLHDERLALQEQHFFLEKIMAASPAGIITFDHDQRVAMINPAAQHFFQRRAEEMMGKRLEEIPSPLAAALRDLRPGESTVVPMQGLRRLKCIRSQFLDRGFPRAFYLLEDMTEELRQSEKAAYEKLIRMMSHEVNNSIGAANSLLHSSLHYQTQLREEDREDFVTALGIAISRTEHLSAFMKSFADIVRLPPPAKQPVDLSAMLGEVCTLLRPECLRRRIELRNGSAAPGPAVKEIDRHQMEQVFMNILRNAIEAIGEEGVITVRLERTGAGILITVEDSGTGIAPELKHLIFTPFFSTKETGQGIGLTLVQEILSHHRFGFSLDGDPGGPTRFTISIP